MNKTFGVQGAGAVPAGLALAVLLALLLVGCGNPQPLPVAPTPIPTLPPVPPPAAVDRREHSAGTAPASRRAMVFFMKLSPSRWQRGTSHQVRYGLRLRT